MTGDAHPGTDNFGSMLPRIRVSPPGPRSLEHARRLARVESRNITHLTPRFPVFWEEAVGCNVRDADGNIYLDLTGAFGVALGGHSAPEVVAALGEQSRRLIHGMGDVHPPIRKVEFLEALSRMAPWPESRAILGSSGSEAVEAALKTALMATAKPGILAFEGAYHGLTLGALAATEREDFRGHFRRRLYPGVAFAPFPDPLRHGKGAAPGSLQAVEKGLREGAGDDEIGAVILEPIQGRAGVRIPPPGFLHDLAEITREAGALLIFDEIFTALGRTGALFACVQEGVIPDLLCLGKGLGGGLPLSACLGPPGIMDAWPDSEGEAIHTSTFLGHPLACAGGVAALTLLEKGGLADRSLEEGRFLRAALGEALEGEPHVAQVRGRGLFLGVELVRAGTLEPLAGGAVRVAEEALKRGILLLPAGARGHVVELSPPLVLTREQGEWVVPKLVDIIRSVDWPEP
ncbi:MAG: aspartate aminotransferase family protein [Longimicrobiales bacterium]